MRTSGPAPRRTWSPADRDAALRRTRRATRVVVFGAAGLTGTFSVVAAQAFKGHAKPKPATTARVQSSAGVPAPQHVPGIAPPVRHRLQAPASAPSSAPAATPAPTPAPAATPAPAPAPAPPPPVASGGS